MGSVDLAVELQQGLDLLRTMTSPAAVGRHAEVVDEALGRHDPGPGAHETVVGVEQAEVQPRLGPQGQLRQHLEERHVDPTALHRQVDPVERAAEAQREGVGDGDEGLGVVRPVAMVAFVAVAEVVAELHVARDAASQPDQPLDDARAWVVEPGRHHAVEHGELEVRVPLDGQLVVGDGFEDHGQLVHHARLVERLDAGLVLRGDERRDGRERRGERDLEPAVHRHLPVALAPGEHLVRGDGGLRVAEVVEAEGLERLAVAQPQAGEGPVRARPGRADLELRPRAEHRVLPHDPVGARAGLAVGHLQEAVTELGGHHLEDVLGAAERDAAHEEHPSRCRAVALVGHHHHPRRVAFGRRRRPCRVSAGALARPSRGFASGERRVCGRRTDHRCVSGRLIPLPEGVTALYVALATAARGRRGGDQVGPVSLCGIRRNVSWCRSTEGHT